MTTSYYRVQTADRNVAGLLDAAQQTSESWNGRSDLTQHGVSVCESREALAAYLADAGAGIPIGVGEWVVVEVAGDLLGPGPDAGEFLIRPTAVVSIAPLDDAMFDLIGAAFDALYT